MGEIELRGFLHLAKRFTEGTLPRTVSLDGEITGTALLARLGIPESEVEAVFINRKAVPLREARIRPGDRVALLPPGTPGPYRILLGAKRIPEKE